MPSVYRRGGRGPWWAAFTGYDGQRRKVSTRVHNHATAKQMANLLEAQHGLVRMGLASPDALLTAQRGVTDPELLVEEWKGTLTGKLDENKRIRASWVRSFLKEQRIVACATFASPEIIERLTKWIDTKQAQETRGKKLAAVRAFGTYLVEHGYCHTNKADAMAAPKPDGKRRIVHLSLEAADAEALWAHPTRGLYYRFRCFTGVRGSEACQLLRSDFVLDDKPRMTVRAEVAKNGLEVTVPLAKHLAERMAEAVGMAHPAARVFPDVSTSRSSRRDQWKDDHAALELPKSVNERSMRMSFNSWLLASGADLADVIRLRRDKGRGAERLASWNYCDGKVIEKRLRATLARLEAWFTEERRAKERQA